MGIVTNDPGSEGERITVDRRVWLNAARDAIVEDGDPAAAFLYATEGKRVPREEAERLGLLVGKGAKRSAPAEDKQASKPEDKQAAKPADKTAGRGSKPAGQEG